MATAKPPATVEVAAQSMVAVEGCPGILDDREWFVPLAGRERRTVRAGDHLPVDHELVGAWPGRFTASPEPPDCWPIGVLLPEVQQERERQRVRNDPAHARLVIPCCRRCGDQLDHGVVVFDAPTQIDLNSALAGLDDHDLIGQEHTRQRFALLAQQAREASDQLLEAEQLWHATHTECPAGTPPLPEPEVPESAPLFRRLLSFRTLD
jgi:hypothetical protein